ncbi:MAG TPA: aldehyde ferredoxin oxidoreductase C-terminal domain-containing protein [Anaerolineae bacterium]|nr:aldehyde ferredoxin oxidoreductase C-terminal domain-containing protein [Anaerolineae bacterium]
MTIEDAEGLWGRDTYDTQEEIWRRVTGRASLGGWTGVGDGFTTQGPAILCIGPAGESRSRLGILLHGCSMAAGQGGFGGVWGAKNLKAISVLGTGSIPVADPRALMETRLWFDQKQPPRQGTWVPHAPPGPGNYRNTSCQGCTRADKFRHQNGERSDAMCAETAYFFQAKTPAGGSTACDYCERYGVNIYETDSVYPLELYKQGILGPGKAIDSAPLDFEQWGTAEFAEALHKAIAYRQGIGADLAEGLARAAVRWGRYEEDTTSGILDLAQWGHKWHWSLPEITFAYGSLMGERDINEHCFQNVFMELQAIGRENLPADQLVQILAEKTIPYTGDPFMFDYGTGPTGIYSEHKAKQVAWHRHYSRFWKESIQFCDHFAPRFIGADLPGYIGWTPEAEPRFLNAVTGKNLTFADGMEIGRRIWNQNRAIWVLQGRHRASEVFAPFMYTLAGSATRYSYVPIYLGGVSVYENGQWRYDTMEKLFIDKDGLEQWKTHFYRLEGWDTETGWPTRRTLEELDLGHVADTLQRAGRLGDAR